MTQYETLRMVAPEAEPRLSRFTAARYDGTIAVDVLAEEALEKILPSEHGDEADLLLIKAFDLGQAMVIAKSGDERLPWKQVKITRDAQVAERWHGQPMNATERSRLDRVLRAERLKLEDQLKREVISFEQQRRAELGL